MDDELAQRLADLVGNMRPASRYALETFLDAAENGMPRASVTLYGPGHKDRMPEASLEIDPRKAS